MREKKMIFEGEEAGQLFGWIRFNDSQAVIGIQNRAERFLKENGYRLEDYKKRNSCYEYDYEYKPDLKSAVEARRIVSTGRKPISDEKIAEIERMHLEGLSGREIARRLKIGEKTVRRYIRKFFEMKNVEKE